MAEAPNLEGSIAALMLRVARIEDRLREMDLPFVEDRLENMETVVAALERALDEFYERFETLHRLVRRLEADMRSLERERQTRSHLPFGDYHQAGDTGCLGEPPDCLGGYKSSCHVS